MMLINSNALQMANAFLGPSTVIIFLTVKMAMMKNTIVQAVPKMVCLNAFQMECVFQTLITVMVPLIVMMDLMKFIVIIVKKVCFFALLVKHVFPRVSTVMAILIVMMVMMRYLTVY